MFCYLLGWNLNHRGKETENFGIFKINLLEKTFFPWSHLTSHVIIYYILPSFSCLKTPDPQKRIGNGTTAAIYNNNPFPGSSAAVLIISYCQPSRSKRFEIWFVWVIKKLWMPKCCRLNCKAQPLREVEWTGIALSDPICSHHSSLKLFDLTSIRQFSQGESLFLHLVQYQCHFPPKMWQGADCFSMLCTRHEEQDKEEEKAFAKRKKKSGRTEETFQPHLPIFEDKYTGRNRLRGRGRDIGDPLLSRSILSVHWQVLQTL